MYTVSYCSFKRALILAATMSLGACAVLPSNTDRPVVVQTEKQAGSEQVTSVAAQQVPQASPIANSTVAELQQLVRNHQIQELRTTYNGSYGASLLFKPESLTYYVTLFQKDNFWRIFKTENSGKAEQTYKEYSRVTAELAQADLDRIKLQAQYSSVEKQLDARASELSVLQNDVALQRQQETLVTAQQVQARQEAAKLADQERQARTQLQTLQQEIKKLEAQQAAISQRGQKPQH